MLKHWVEILVELYAFKLWPGSIDLPERTTSIKFFSLWCPAHYLRRLSVTLHMRFEQIYGAPALKKEENTLQVSSSSDVYILVAGSLALAGLVPVARLLPRLPGPGTAAWQAANWAWQVARRCHRLTTESVACLHSSSPPCSLAWTSFGRPPPRCGDAGRGANSVYCGGGKFWHTWNRLCEESALGKAQSAVHLTCRHYFDWQAAKHFPSTVSLTVNIK